MFIYIEEAHAADEWPIGSATVERQARTVAERRAAADRLGLSDRWSLYVDSMDNSFAAAYSPWPFRYYLLDAERRARIIAEPIGAALPLGELWDAARSLAV